MPGKNLVSFEKAASTASYAEIQVLIGRQLNAGYDVAEPIPDRLAELLKQLARPLDEGESKTDRAGGLLVQ
jgi:hypothetical protein